MKEPECGGTRTGQITECDGTIGLFRRMQKKKELKYMRECT